MRNRYGSLPELRNVFIGWQDRRTELRRTDMPRTFEIMFADLNDQAQRSYLEFMGVESPSELNADVFPIATVDVEDEEETSEDD